MAYILHIETTSTVCSIAISNDKQLIALKETNNGYTHAENLHIFIELLLKDTTLKSSDLQAIAVSSGPGSYTGLRIGFSAAKGLAYALSIPLIVVNTLKALSVLAVEKANNEDAIYIPLMDARRMEVYCALYDNSLNNILPIQAMILNEENCFVFNSNKKTYFFGDGMIKAKELLSKLPNANFIENIVASSTSMINLAFEQYKVKNFADVAYVEPNYLKEFFFTTAKK